MTPPQTDPNVLRHGGALDAAIARHGGSRADWLDLSTGINPSPPRLPDLDPALWQRLPEAALEARALAAARHCYGAPAGAGLVAAPGTQALIAALPHLFAPADIAILTPTYSEHALTFASAGHRVSGFERLEAVPTDAQIVVVVNPNNPDGRVFEPADLLALADRPAASGGLLIVDEAFADVAPSRSLASATGRDGLLVYRSFGKFFGLAGLRLGFALTAPALATRLAERLGTWAVSGPALAVGATLLGDASVVDQIRTDILRQHELLRTALDGAGLPLVGGTALFTTVSHPSAHALFAALCRRQILVRPFTAPREWLRFGNPADAQQARRLETALREALAEIGTS
ncbi:threonine-phosphate decarboxylase CobD [Aurantimonas sp. A2-1-M11]|uniref:threonine-phosphate decarboxylase CobD n=1 Tax=Aurantimonas sp. A2-1-M11 TaxID=3113712 RepID=UPI002F93D2C2